MSEELSPGSRWLLPVVIDNIRVSEDGNARAMGLTSIYMSEEGPTVLIPQSRITDLEVKIGALDFKNEMLIRALEHIDKHYSPSGSGAYISQSNMIFVRDAINRFKA